MNETLESLNKEEMKSSEAPSNSTERKAGRKRTKTNNNLSTNEQEEKSKLNNETENREPEGGEFESNEPENTETEDVKTIKTGDVIDTSLILVYQSSVAKKHFTGIKGQFYIWDSEIVNNRIRITNSLNGVGDISKIIGWVNVKDIVK